MTVSASFHPQDSFPPPFSLGALFGFRKGAQPSWRYEPPSLPQKAEPLDLLLNKQSPPFQLDSIPFVEPTAPTRNPTTYRASHPAAQITSQIIPKRTKRAVELDVHSIENKVEPGAITQAQTVDVDFEACFEDFKSQIAHAGDLTKIDFRNILISRAFRACSPTHSDAWIYNVMVMKHLTQLCWDPAPVVGKKAGFTIPPPFTTESLELLRCIETLTALFPNRVRNFHPLNVKLAEAAVAEEASTITAQDDELLLLVRQLWQSACSQSGKERLSAMDLLFKVVTNIQDRSISRPLQSVIANAADMKHAVSRLVINASQSPDQYLAANCILSCIPRQNLVAVVPSITFSLAKAMESKTRPSNLMYTNRFSTWLQLLHGLDTNNSSSGRPASSMVDDAIATIAKHVFVHRLPATIRCRWDTLLKSMILKLTQQDASYTPLGDRLLHLVDSSAILAREQEGSLTLERWLGAILSRMQQASLPYDELTKMMVTLLVQHENMGLVLRFLGVMDEHMLKISDASALFWLIRKKVAILRQPPTISQTETERQHNAFLLTTCERIRQVLNRISSPAGVGSFTANAKQTQELQALQAQRQFLNILDRAQAALVLPLAYRDLTANIPLDKRTALIHQLAHQYSLDITRSRLQAWRSLYYLYRYLQKQSLPIGPLFTKAVVRVAIIRPLSENRFISVRRLIWVCRLVAKVEGEDVARNVESNFWHWRGNLIRHAKNVYVSAGGDKRDKAHVNTMKKLGLI
ncbi:hypothetical protein N0V83_008199 [Neocucurbitaria cava]|uniref:Uncharacterized protein n=1 Tax=Neocucurbitaria cava TaxID=798079 RepID=A0A9W8Y460_9PLEO|nr:hypothetical protein N0V83_008199 [Neocucurbitaria cava]